MPDEAAARQIAEYIWDSSDAETRIDPESVALMRTAHPEVRPLVARLAGIDEPPSLETWALATRLFRDRVREARWGSAA